MKPITSIAAQPVGLAKKGVNAEKTSNSASVSQAAKAPGSSVGATISALVGEGAPINEQRVTELRDALANGQYPIDSGKLAAKMLELDLGI